MVDTVRAIQDEVGAVCSAVGRDGAAGKRMRRLGALGGWAGYVHSGHGVIDDPTGPRRGEFMRHARIVNGMVARLSQFGSEVTRVAQEVGGEGKLGAQARV